MEAAIDPQRANRNHPDHRESFLRVRDGPVRLLVGARYVQDGADAQNVIYRPLMSVNDMSRAIAKDFR
jgi:hypothetical protein